MSNDKTKFSMRINLLSYVSIRNSYFRMDCGHIVFESYILCIARNYPHPQHNYSHDDVIKWKHFPRYWPFVREIPGHRWLPLTMASDAELWCFFLLICAWTYGWVNNRDADDLRRHCSHYDDNLMSCCWVIAFKQDRIDRNGDFVLIVTCQIMLTIYGVIW